MILLIIYVFFKQKTAYEIGWCDWSSDVCSSDLRRALSSAYVERRHAVASGLDGAGKRAAFALYYAPLHFRATSHVLHAVGAASPPPRTIVDLGCGTGAAGAAWAHAA